MASFLTTSQKTTLADVFDNMHDTFKRDIVIYQQSTSIWVATNDTYNALYQRLANASTSRTEVTSTTVGARILYVDRQVERDIGGVQAQINVPFSDGIVRIKIEKTGYDIFKKASEIEVDGAVYSIISDASAIGPFVVKFYTLYLQRAN